MATLVTYTCKSFVKLTPGWLVDEICLFSGRDISTFAITPWLSNPEVKGSAE